MNRLLLNTAFSADDILYWHEFSQKVERRMRDEFRQLVVETLRRGEDLPIEWARELFPPEKREYELVYYDKEREEDILT